MFIIVIFTYLPYKVWPIVKSARLVYNGAPGSIVCIQWAGCPSQLSEEQDNVGEDPVQEARWCYQPPHCSPTSKERKTKQRKLLCQVLYKNFTVNWGSIPSHCILPYYLLINHESQSFIWDSLKVEFNDSISNISERTSQSNILYFHTVLQHLNSWHLQNCHLESRK